MTNPLIINLAQRIAMYNGDANRSQKKGLFDIWSDEKNNKEIMIQRNQLVMLIKSKFNFIEPDELITNIEEKQFCGTDVNEIISTIEQQQKNIGVKKNDGTIKYRNPLL